MIIDYTKYDGIRYEDVDHGEYDGLVDEVAHVIVEAWREEGAVGPIEPTEADIEYMCDVGRLGDEEIEECCELVRKLSKEAHVTCQCGIIIGGSCQSECLESEMAKVHWIPGQHRGSVEALGGPGALGTECYVETLMVDPDCLEYMTHFYDDASDDMVPDPYVWVAKGA